MEDQSSLMQLFYSMSSQYDFISKQKERFIDDIPDEEELR